MKGILRMSCEVCTPLDHSDLVHAIKVELAREDYVPCECAHQASLLPCLRMEHHLGKCVFSYDGQNFVTYFCRERDDIPHGLPVPELPFLGPREKKRAERRTRKLSFGDYFRTPLEVTKEKLQRFSKEHPEIPIPDFLRKKFLQ